ETFETCQTTRAEDDDIALLLGRRVENHRGHVTTGQLGLVGHTGSRGTCFSQSQDIFGIRRQTGEAVRTPWPVRLHVEQTHHELLRPSQLYGVIHRSVRPGGTAGGDEYPTPVQGSRGRLLDNE